MLRQAILTACDMGRDICLSIFAGPLAIVAIY